MTKFDEGYTMMKSYLLDELSPEQREEVERTYFADSKVFEELQMIEAELIDDYASGEMDSMESAKFERIYLSNPSKKFRVDFAKSLHQKADEGAPLIASPTRSRWLVAALLALAAAASLFFAETLRLRGQIARINDENQRLQKQYTQLQKESSSNQALIEDLKIQVDREKMDEDVNPPAPIAPALPQPTLIAFVLKPGLARDAASMPILKLPRRADFVRFELQMDRDPYQAYRVSLQTPAGDEVWSMGTIHPRIVKNGKAIVFDLPANKLTKRDYVILLQGKGNGKFQDVSAYPFRNSLQ